MVHQILEDRWHYLPQLKDQVVNQNNKMFLFVLEFFLGLFDLTNLDGVSGSGI